jgi:polyhydroxybutyrate depolymerase
MASVDDNGTVIARYLYESGEAGSTVVHYKAIGGGHVWFTELRDEGKGTGELVWGFFSQFDLEGLR